MHNVLVVCTGNSCRSILAEALFTHLGGDRLQAFSAGSHPTGTVNPNALATLNRHGLPNEGYSSKSWDSLSALPMDIVITVCDEAAGEDCPAFPSRAVKGHWGLPDPARLKGTPAEIDAAFEATYRALEHRIRRFLALPFESMAGPEVADALERIGREADV